MGRKVGKVNRVKNTEIKTNENAYYNIVTVIDITGSRKVLMLSDHDMQRAIDRASKNKEDYPKVGWFRKFLDWLS